MRDRFVVLPFVLGPDRVGHAKDRGRDDEHDRRGAPGAMPILRINRPHVRNCVDGETAVGLAEAIEGFAADHDARVLVVTGTGDLAFCAGADLKDPLSLLRHRYVDVAGPMGFARLDPRKPTIAAVNGYCFAGGFELAAWCDFRIAAANAEFGCLSRRWGVPYTDGGTQRFARIVGLGHALYLLEPARASTPGARTRWGSCRRWSRRAGALRALELAGCDRLLSQLRRHPRRPAGRAGDVRPRARRRPAARGATRPADAGQRRAGCRPGPLRRRSPRRVPPHDVSAEASDEPMIGARPR